MKFIKTDIADSKITEPDVFTDERGCFLRLFKKIKS